MTTEQTKAATDKATELIEKFSEHSFMNWHEVHGFNHQEQFNNAKACALILCYEMIDSFGQYEGMHDQEFFDSDLRFWQTVREIIKNK